MTNEMLQTNDTNSLVALTIRLLVAMEQRRLGCGSIATQRIPGNVGLPKSGVGWFAAPSQPNKSRKILACQKGGNPIFYMAQPAEL